MSHRLYLHFETLFLVLLEMKSFVLQQNLPKDTLFTIHLIFQGKLCLKISDQKQKNVTRGWGSVKSKKVSRII